MAKFDMGAAWEDCVTLLRSHSALTGAVAAVFLFLPALAVAWFGPAPIEPADGAGFQQIVENIKQNMWQIMPYQLAAALFGLIGTVAILRLWLSRSGTSVGQALGFAVTLFPTVVIIQILTNVAMAAALVLFIIPGLYVAGRLAVVMPAMTDRSIRNPIEAIRQGWVMTEGNGWAIFFFVFLVAIVIFIVAMILGGLASAFGGSGPGVGRMIAGAIEAAVGAVGALVSIAVSAAIYRQLAVGRASAAFD